MAIYLQTIVDGVLLGGVYGILAVGLSLVFGVLGIVNFAQAEFVMIGMYVAWVCWKHLGIDPLLAAPIAFAVAFALGLVIHANLIERILKAPPVAQIFLTVGLLSVLENGALMLFSADSRSVVTSAQTQALEIGPVFVSVTYLNAFVAAAAVSLAMWLFLARSWTGRAIRATAQNRMAASAFGVDARRIYAMTFALGVGLSALGGAIVLPYASVNPTTGGQYVVLMFTAVVLGGLGNIAGALVGGLAIGIVQSASALILPLQLQNLAIFLMFLALLILKPQGLLGAKR